MMKQRRRRLLLPISVALNFVLLLYVALKSSSSCSIITNPGSSVTKVVESKTSDTPSSVDIKLPVDANNSPPVAKVVASKTRNATSVDHIKPPLNVSSKTKSYGSPKGITLTGGDGHVQDMHIDGPQCPSVCMKCLNVLASEAKPKQSFLSRKKAPKGPIYNNVYCYYHCDEATKTCGIKKKKKSDVDCTNCRRVVQRAVFDPLEPVEDADATCGGIVQWGKGDDTKFLCKNLVSQWTEGCIIVSLGCNGQWGFEVDAYENSPCEIHTFDCTGSWHVPFAIGSRVTLHKKCVGTAEAPQERDTKAGYGGVKGNRMITLDHVVDIVGGRPDYLKADIEGYEWALLPSMMANSDESLPAQIQVEFHWIFPMSLTQMMQNLRERYAVLKRHDNPYCFHCSEILLVLKDKIAGRPVSGEPAR